MYHEERVVDRHGTECLQHFHAHQHRQREGLSLSPGNLGQGLRLGFKIKEVPIIFTDRKKGQSKMSSSIFKEAVLGVLFMKIKSWFKKY